MTQGVADVLQLPWPQVAAALGLTALNYAVLTGYDLLAFASIGKRLPRLQIARVSLLAYAISNTVGLAALSGASIRYRFYTRWGITTAEFSRLVLAYSITFWLGLLTLGGVSLLGSHLGGAAGLPPRHVMTAAGWLLLLVTPAYLVSSALRIRPLRIRRFELQVPALRIASAQVLLSAVDWVLAGGVLYVLLPPGTVPFLPFLGMFLIAVLLGLISHVPGGLGVFDGLMILLLGPYASSGDLIPALVAFRTIYYLLPFSIGMFFLTGHEGWQQRHRLARAGTTIGRLLDRATPTVLAAATFVAGVMLLFSSATPAAPGRLALLEPIVPLAIIEASHFLSSILGMALLILSQGLARRLDAAYYFTSAAMFAGMAVSLLKGLDVEEAAVLLTMAVVLWRARPAFTRKAAFFDTRFSPGWLAAVATALGASVWLGFFAFRHVQYSNELWWQFEQHGEASRFLRGSVGAAVALALVALGRLVRHAPHEAPAPSDTELAEATRIIEQQALTYPYLALLRDKALLFNEHRDAFIMYGVQGRTWVALGDPVGPPESFPALIQTFLERCHDFGGVPVFYEVGRGHLHLYADTGLTFAKLGEEAKVDLTAFTLEGSRASKHRQAVRRLEKEGALFRVLDPAAVTAHLAELREVSDEWLADRAGHEKGFSLGFFDDRYVSSLPVAVIEQDGSIQAFANIWPGRNHDELSIDLMRFRHGASRSLMESLIVCLMRWGHEQGYRRFALGMAPLSGVGASCRTTLWNRLGAFVYEHGEAFYGFRGLRAFKEKFHPEWEPRYLAYPGGLRLPRIMADVSALIAGGYRAIFTTSPSSP